MESTKNQSTNHNRLIRHWLHVYRTLTSCLQNPGYLFLQNARPCVESSSGVLCNVLYHTLHTADLNCIAEGRTAWSSTHVARIPLPMPDARGRLSPQASWIRLRTKNHVDSPELLHYNLPPWTRLCHRPPRSAETSRDSTTRYDLVVCFRAFFKVRPTLELLHFTR